MYIQKVDKDNDWTTVSEIHVYKEYEKKIKDARVWTSDT